MLLDGIQSTHRMGLFKRGSLQILILVLAGSIISFIALAAAEEFEGKRHPLDPLSEKEILQTAQLIKTNYPTKWDFLDITLKEPPKSIMYPYIEAENNGLTPTVTIPRKSFAVIHEMVTSARYEVVVDLDKLTIQSFRKTPEGTPVLNYNIAKKDTLIRKISNDSRIINMLRRRGVQPKDVQFNFWPNPYRNFFHPGKTFCQFYMYAQNFVDDNFYAQPLDFTIVADVDELKITSIDELPVHDQFKVRKHNIGVSIPRESDNLDPSLPGFEPGQLREDVKPLQLNFPKGGSYSLDGNVLSWQNFKFRIGFNRREGIVLYNVVYQDGDKIRPLFYRMSLAEVIAVYGDPRPPYQRKSVFDEGQTLNYPETLVDGLDCIGATAFLSSPLGYQEEGGVRRIKNAVCISEEDDGILWKRTSEVTDKTLVRRSRRLTLMQTHVNGNYEYIYMWHFYQDASISFEVRLSGVVATTLIAKGATPFGYGTQVFPQVDAIYHQHGLTVRIDPMIDGSRLNTVSTLDVVPLPTSPQNPFGNAITTQQTVLKTPVKSQTNVNSKKSRVWKITNDNHKHVYTREPVGYKLIPMNTPPLLLNPSSPYYKLFEFARYSTSVTPYDDEQLFPAGFYVGQNGLSDWIRRDGNADIVNKDVVLWHTFTLAHIPRVEDFPVMSQEHIGFTLKPVNFFMANPALDVP